MLQLGCCTFESDNAHRAPLLTWSLADQQEMRTTSLAKEQSIPWRTEV
jgi:hypothetical protein